MPSHERDLVRDQMADCVFADRDLTRPVPKYTFPRIRSLVASRSLAHAPAGRRSTGYEDAAFDGYGIVSL